MANINRRKKCLISIALMFSAVGWQTKVSLAANISLFYDSSYVRPNESLNVLQSLERLGHSVTTFSGTDEEAWQSATSNSDAVIVPSLVWAPVLVNDLTQGAKNAVKGYVTSGGRLICHGRGANLFSIIFDYRLFGSSGYVSETNLDSNAATGTSFASGPASLPLIGGTTFPLDTLKLPANALPIYHKGDHTADVCYVMAGGYGEGSLIYLAMEWRNPQYFPPEDVEAWESVLNAAVAFTHSPQPRADAGPDQVVSEGALVILDGTGSSDPENDALNYSWKQVYSFNLPDPIELQGANTAQPAFIAPYVPHNVAVTFLLEVNDGTNYSAPDLVNVTIQQTNNPPVADAGDDGTLKVGSRATLNGLQSYDPDGNPIASYKWTQAQGPPVTLAPGNNVPDPSFDVPLEPGAVLIFKLQVSDGMESSWPSPGVDPNASDTVAYTLVLNSPPVAKPGSHQTVNEGSRVTLDGKESYDPDLGDSLSYAWEQISGIPVQLDDPTSPTPSFEAPLLLNHYSGEFLRFALVVKDDDPAYPLTSEPARVTIYVRNSNQPPTCAYARSSIGKLWPPDHKLQLVEILGVSDQGTPSNELTLKITEVSQDEPTTNQGNGDTGPDAFIQSNDNSDSLLLRAERDGYGNGRIYQIYFTASDGFESCTGSVSVEVPPNRQDSAIENAQSFDSTQ